MLFGNQEESDKLDYAVFSDFSFGLYDLKKNLFVNFHGTGKEAVFGYKYVRIAGFSHVLGYSVSADGRKMGEYCN